MKAFSKNDLEAEFGRSRHGLPPPQNMLPHTNPQISSPMLSRSCTPTQPNSQKRTSLSVGLVKKCEPGINVFFIQNRKLLGILHYSAVVNSTYHPFALSIYPFLFSCFLFLHFKSICIKCYIEVTALATLSESVSMNKTYKNNNPHVKDSCCPALCIICFYT